MAKAAWPALAVDAVIYTAGLIVLPADIGADDWRALLFGVAGFGTTLYAAALAAHASRSLWAGIGYGVLFWFVWKIALFTIGSLGGFILRFLDLSETGWAILGYVIAQFWAFPIALPVIAIGAAVGFFMSRRRAPTSGG